jgi:hypothetical protein
MIGASARCQKQTRLERRPADPMNAEQLMERARKSAEGISSERPLMSLAFKPSQRFGLTIQPVFIVGHVEKSFLLPPHWGGILDLRWLQAFAKGYGALPILVSLCHAALA